MRKLIHRIAIFAASFVLSGCARPATDVTSSPEYNFSSFAGTAWKTKVKTALAEIRQGSPKFDLRLITPDSFDSAHPEYRPIADMHVAVVLTAGTRVRIERLMKDNGNWGGVWATASLDDGKVVHLSARFLAKNRFIWPGWSDSKDWGADSDMLEKAD
jgi:hypothetical protein